VIERRNMTDEQGTQGLPKGQGGHENKTEEPVDVPGVRKGGGGVGNMSEDDQPTLEEISDSSVGFEVLEGEPQGDADELSSPADQRTIQPLP
jgi:hypothetical protein